MFFKSVVCFFLFLLIYQYQAFAQGYMVTMSSTVPNDITICGSEKSFSVQIYNPSPNLLTGIVLTVTMPSGMYYITGSITGATEYNISNLSAPQFALTDLPTLTSRNLTFNASAGCDIMSFLAAGNPAQNHLRIDYLANGHPFYDTHTTFTYVVKQPNLSITSVTNQSYSGQVGDNFQRCITITNGGLGELSTFIFRDQHGNGLVVNATDKGNRITQGNTEIITLSGADFATIGNGNSLFESGESITICENITVTNCISVLSTFIAEWGCHNQICQYSTSSANVVFPNLTPHLTVSHQPSQSACYGMNQPNQQQLTITNTGLGTATQVAFTIFQSTGTTYHSAMTSYIDANSFTYQIGSGPVVSVNVTVTGTNAAYGCMGGIPRPGRVVVNLPDIPGGQTVYLRWNTYSCCHDYCSGNSPHAGTNNGWSYQGSYSNICQNNYVVPITYARGYSQLYADLTNNGSPGTISSGQRLTYRFLFSNDINSYTSTSAREWRFVVTMPPCVTYAGNAQIVAQNGTTTWNPTSAIVAGNTLTISFTGNQPFNRINGDLRFDLVANCGGGCTGGPGTLRIESFFVSDPGCACVHRLSCYNLPLNVVCPTQCVGMNISNFRMERTSYGLRDDNNDGVPEPGPVTLNLIRTDRAMFGDTLTATFSGTVLGGSFPYLFAQSSVTNGNDYLTYVDGVLTISRGATTYTCSIPPPSISNAGNVRTFQYDLSSTPLSAMGCVPAGFLFEQGDIVEFRARYRVSRNPGGVILTCEVANEFYHSLVPNPVQAADKLWCNNYTATFSIIGYYYTNWGPNSIQVSSCDQFTISQNYYLSIGPCCQQYAGGNLFPFEYRRWAWPKNLIVTPPPGYTFVSARFNHTRTSGSGSISVSSWYSITPINPQGPTYDFYVEPYFSQYGGPLLESDDGFYGTLEVTLIPSCAVVPNVASAVAYDWYFGESTILQGSNTSNRSFVSNQDFITYQGPNLFVQSLLPSVLAQDHTVSWDVSISNTTNIPAHHVFVTAPQISGVTVVEVFDMTNNVIVAPTPSGIYPLGQIAANGVRDLRITATYTSCSIDSIIVHVGWNCLNYPTNLAAYPCTTDKIKLSLTPQIPTLIVQITSPANTVDLCDTATYVVEGINIQLGTAYELKLRVILPAGVSIIHGSAEMSYPPGAPFVSIPNPTFLMGTTYEWDLSTINTTLGTNGLKGILQNTLNSVKVRFRVRTDCSYTSGSLIGFVFHGRSSCGLYTGQEITLSSQLAITGADKPYHTKVDLISTYISPCTNSTLMTVNVVNMGPLPTGPNDSIIVVFPPAISFVNGTYTAIYNSPPSNTFMTYMLNNRQYVQWKLPPNILPGDSIRFSFRFTADAFALSCNIQNFEAYTVSSKNVLCILNHQSCGINVRTGDTILPMYVYKARLNIDNLEAIALQNAPHGETLQIELTIFNSGENIAQGIHTVIDFYRDVDGNGHYSAADLFLGRDTITAGINTNAAYTYSTTLNVAAGNGCNLIAVLDPINNACICNMAQQFLNTIPLRNAGFHQAACSGATITLGGQPITNYQYSWSPSSGLSNPNSYTTHFSMSNQSGNNMIISYTLTTHRINCTSIDTAMVTVYPETLVSFSGLNAAYCNNESPSVLMGNPFGGMFSGPGIQGNIFSPLIAGAGTKSIIYSYTDINNCTWRDTQQTLVYTAPRVNMSGLMVDYCIDAPDVPISVQPNGGTLSGNGITGNVFSPSQAGAGQHQVTYTFIDTNQCSDTITRTVTVHALPVVSFAGLNPQYCMNEPAALLIPQPAGGVFSGAGINNGNMFEPRLAGPGSFPIIYTYRNQYQCQNADTQIVTVFSLTQVNLSGLSPQYCIDASPTTLNGQPTGGVFSGNGVSGNNFIPSLADTGNHWIYYSFTDSNNCTSRDSQLVRINSLPMVHFSGLASDYCIDAAPVALIGNQAAGIFSGMGMAGNRFIPASAGIGTHQITYSHTDANGCFNADTQITTIHPLPTVAFSGLDTSYCSDAPPVTLIGIPAGGIFSGNGINQHVFSAHDAGVGYHLITYSFTDTNHCTASVSQAVRINPVPTADASLRHISCFGAHDGSITLHISNGTAPFEVNWNNYNNTAQYLTGLAAGSYILQLTDAKGCTFTATYNITEPEELTSAVETHDVKCYGENNGSAIIQVKGGTPPYQYIWSNQHTESANYSLPAGEYSVTIVDAQGCSRMHQFTISQPSELTIKVMPPIDTIAYGNTVQLHTEYSPPDLFATYSWEPPAGLSCTRCAHPMASPDVSTSYQVTIIDEAGCMASAEVLVVVNQEHVYYAPNIFSPNGDGINDVFQIFVKGVREFHLQIHDRWGQRVFHTDHPYAAWNGTFNGKELPNGVYVYEAHVIYYDGTVYKKKGSVTLVR